MIKTGFRILGLLALTPILAAQSSTPALQDISFAPLRDPFPVPFLPAYVWWIICVLACVIAVSVVWIVRSSRESRISESSKINPLNIALDAIRALDGRLEELEAREFSSEVSEIVRRYIEQACEIPAQEQTTEEFLGSIQRNRYFNDEIKGSLETFLGLCDMAKFAQQSVDVTQRKELLKEARQLVEKLYRFVVRRSNTENSVPVPPPIPLHKVEPTQ